MDKNLSKKYNNNNKPYYYTKQLDNLIGEEFRDIRGLEGKYAVSNFGRVKRLNHFDNDKNYTELVLTPRKGTFGSKFRLNIRGFNYNVQDLVFDSFIGLDCDKLAFCVDGDRRNLHLSNLKQEVKCWRSNQARKTPNKKPKLSKKKPLSAQIDINDGDKETNLLHINSMKGEGYCLKSEKNGVYFFELLPKEGDTVKVKNSQYIDKKEYKVTKKDGIKCELEGYGEGIYFLANELEIIKQS